MSFHRRELKLVFLERQLNFRQDGTIFSALAFLTILVFPVELDPFFSQSRRFFADSAFFIFDYKFSIDSFAIYRLA